VPTDNWARKAILNIEFGQIFDDRTIRSTRPIWKAEHVGSREMQ
jgi:hypothetical protein